MLGPTYKQKSVVIAPRVITKVQRKQPVATNAQRGTTTMLKTVLLNALNVKVDSTTKDHFKLVTNFIPQTGPVLNVE